jgi:hypothetical protein
MLLEAISGSVMAGQKHLFAWCSDWEGRNHILRIGANNSISRDLFDSFVNRITSLEDAPRGITHLMKSECP